MKINELILNKMMPIPKRIFELTNKHIVEVDHYHQTELSEHLVIGHVLTCIDHPNSDHLHLTTVDVGNEILPIVCGASNVQAGQYVVVAKVGAKLGENFVIKESKIRGEISQGMICSLSELGFDDQMIPEAFKQGIYYFDHQVEVGSLAQKALYLDGFVMELGLTPNRGDLLSHLGYAYDLAAVINQPLQLKQYPFVFSNKKSDLVLNIQTNQCLTYYATKVDVTIKPSPLWLQMALIKSGIQPINNVVDITNYVLLAIGTPMHAFDYDVFGQTITVRQADHHDEVVTLDGVKRTLLEEDIVIANNRPQAIAGIMGLENSKITEKTKTIILEIAVFNRVRIQKTSKRLGLRTDSSLRFERGVDQDIIEYANQMALSLLQTYADAVIYQDIKQFQGKKEALQPIVISTKDINQVLGTRFKQDQIQDYLQRLRYKITLKDQTFTLIPPSNRFDILLKADVIEEIARIYGLDEIKNKALPNYQIGGLTTKQKHVRTLRHFLANQGLTEVINYSLLDAVNVHDFSYIGESIHVLKPLSDDKSTLRQSLINGLVSTAIYNMSRQQKQVFIFEIGHVFAKDIEKNKLAILMMGPWYAQRWKNKSLEADFFLLKGILEQLGYLFNHQIKVAKTETHRLLHPIKQGNIMLNGQAIGLIGELHPKYQKDHKLYNAVVLEIDIDTLIQSKPMVYQNVSKFPSVERDLAIVVDMDVTGDQIESLIWQTGRPYIDFVEIFDVFIDQKLGEHKQSIAIKMVFSSVEKTLESEEIDKVMKKIINRLSFEVKAVIRQ